MKTNQFLKWLPSSFILIGIGLWVNSLCFSPITNSYEIDLEKDWLGQLEQGDSIIDLLNRELYFGVKLGVTKYRGDEETLNSMSQIISLKEKTIQLLDEHLERSDTSIYNIIAAFEYEKKAILYNAIKENPVISEEEIEDVLSQQLFTKVDFSGDIALFIKNAKQQIHILTRANLGYLSTKTGGGCFFFTNSPSLMFRTNVLKKGDLAQGKVFLYPRLDNNNIFISKSKYIINGESRQAIRSAVKFKKTFKSTNPQVFEVEYQHQEESFGRQRNVIDTIAIKENFIIYPIN